MKTEIDLGIFFFDTFMYFYVLITNMQKLSSLQAC